MKTESWSSIECQARAEQFDYDPTLPFDLQESGREFRQGIAVHNVSYASVAQGRVGAFLVVPPGKAKFPALVVVHPDPGNRCAFLDEAILLAHHGAVSFLIDAPWSREDAGGRALGEPEQALAEHLARAKDLRRAIDLLSARSDVDAEHVAYVGHGGGALFGGILAGVERRITTFVLMAGIGSFADLSVFKTPRPRALAIGYYREVLASLDPLYYIHLAAPAPLLFQFGLQDRTFARAKFIEFAAAGSEPKAVKWYNADHFLSDPAARRDRLGWLQMHLGLDRPEEARRTAAASGTPRL